MLPHPIPVVPWTQLTHFWLQIERMRELEVLRQATNLQDLEIVPGGPSPQERRTSPEIRFMFSLLSVLNLIDLHLIYAGKPVLPHIKAQNTITKPRITQLLITAGDSTETYTFPSLKKLLNLVGNLQHLILRSARALLSDDISLLNPSPANAPLLHLKTLDVRSCTFNFDHSIFVGIVNTRRGGSDTKWNQLQTVYLGSSLVLDDFAAGIWQDIVDDGLKVVY
ncbi:hypothetical protein EDD85DRAFT_959560 [Armillaria nabsnona]|nr:hypothetical protein EDD85DRAFT_959560 [Armillaria nabsnona]